MAVILSLLITMVFGKRLIAQLRYLQVGETVRDLGLEGQKQKQGTPTMGGLIIIAAIVLPTLLFAKMDNIYILLMLGVVIWLGLIGFIDDYIKVFKKDKEGLAGKFKVLGQVIIGLIVGLVMYYNPQVVVREKLIHTGSLSQSKETYEGRKAYIRNHFTEEVHSTKTNVPFYKNNEFDYARILVWMGPNFRKYAAWAFIPIVIFIIIAVSNGANITDGIDGLATGTSAIIGAGLGILAYVSGNLVFSDYLNIMYIPNSGELVIFAGAFLGATVGFLWYNSFPAQVFMGDTGSLALGGSIAVFAIIIRKELLIPVLCGIFLVEELSVVMQVSWFKFTKRKYGEGKRIFLMSPLHHHFQKQGYHESKIVTRFWIIGIMLAIITIVTLKLR
jgi:phospho-N-acetylmuramoyl-pentapeptide-transferase